MASGRHSDDGGGGGGLELGLSALRSVVLSRVTYNLYNRSNIKLCIFLNEIDGLLLLHLGGLCLTLACGWLEQIASGLRQRVRCSR